MLLIGTLALAALVHSADTTKKKTDSLPLVADRNLDFETTEGTWMSLDVSPDGQTIVFELLGDIYTMPISGRVRPRRSPRGRRSTRSRAGRPTGSGSSS
jgi:hypothetical protein